MLGNLESYLRGNRDAMSIIAEPSPLQEQQCSVVRYREQLVRNRRRAEARGRALALTQGILERDKGKALAAHSTLNRLELSAQSIDLRYHKIQVRRG